MDTGSKVRRIETGDEGKIVRHIMDGKKTVYWGVWFGHCIQGRGSYASCCKTEELTEVCKFTLPPTKRGKK